MLRFHPHLASPLTGEEFCYRTGIAAAKYWPSVRLDGKFFPMFPLTMEGLEQAVKKLVVKS